MLIHRCTGNINMHSIQEKFQCKETKSIAKIIIDSINAIEKWNQAEILQIKKAAMRNLKSSLIIFVDMFPNYFWKHL